MCQNKNSLNLFDHLFDTSFLITACGELIMIYKNIKVIIDFILSLTAIVVLSPIMLLIWILIKIDSKGPAVFKQKRVGRDRREFVMYKFRTMRIDAPKNCPTSQLSDPYKYITRLGRILRKTSLDEIPQLFNVLKGDMSIVGPRPVVPNETQLIEERDKRGVYTLRPGITGLAQIHGRDNVDDFHKARYDAVYSRNVSFTTDCYIFVKTILAVFTHEGFAEGCECHQAKNDVCEQNLEINRHYTLRQSRSDIKIDSQKAG